MNTKIVYNLIKETLQRLKLLLMKMEKAFRREKSQMKYHPFGKA